MLPSAATVGVATNAAASEPEMSVGFDQVLPKSCVTELYRCALTVTPFWTSEKSPYVTIAFPEPQAATYSLSRSSPTLVSTPEPAATRETFHVLPPSPEFATSTSGFDAFDDPTKRNPSVA